MPIFFMSGALFPLNDLPVALAFVTRLNPLAYGIDGLRGALIDASHFGIATNFVVLGAVAIAFLVFGARSFSRIQL